MFEVGCWMFDASQAARVDASRVTCPVLVIPGREDRVVPVWAMRQVAHKYGPVSTCREFEHHAHWLLGEPGWERVADEVLSWLTSQGLGT